MINSNQILEEVNVTSIKFMLKEGFYGHFFSGLIKQVDTSIETLAVSYHNGLVRLHINPTFWTETLNTQDFRMGVIKHEILHIVFKHIFRFKDFSKKDIFNVAADLVVNQYIERNQLIDGAVFLEKFPEMKFLPDQAVGYYYNKLLDLYNEQMKKQEKENKNQNDCDCEGDGESEGNKTGENKGKGGGKTKKEKPNISWENLKNFLREDNPNQGQHKFWRNVQDLPSAEREIAEQAINQALARTIQRTKSDQFGKLPAGLQQYLNEFTQSQVPLVNWKRLLKIFATSSVRTYVKNTLRRPSKRYGTTPGIKIVKKHKLLIAIDTSGSINMIELEEFFSEIYHIWRSGAEIRVVECDTHIHSNYLYTGKAPKTVKGGGGTAFEQPLLYANEEFHPDALIYFTDGYGAAPSVLSRCPVMWLLSKGGADIEGMKDFLGRKLKMN